MQERLELHAEVPESLIGKRLDQALAELFSDYSRSRIKDWILAGHVQINQQVWDKPREKLMGGELVLIQTSIEVQQQHKAQAMALNIQYEDEHILVLNKPADLVVHPGAGNSSGTLLNALLNHVPNIGAVPRAGIVHRLDKDTTGLMVVAKTIPAQTNLVEQLQAREISREYEAVVNGTMVAGGTVDEPIARHETKRTSMAVRMGGKPAVTHYRVIQKFRAHTHLRLKLETGRTHQIRVHMAHLHHPIVGDPLYGGRPRPPKSASEELRDMLRDFKRQALHAAQLELAHPITGEWLSWQAPLPQDMVDLLTTLRADTKAHDQGWD
ncbi:23S rRNA pseudouridine(1911/1915/1917) synthase RluD [Bowmanella sp. Y26]|uniref:23S rRNA pseudouridine(1911/1915/1917) synthase RluD n=1 Tax=Bowmanella yangjiangensis TaxID=2811230 RepID=UPI001BDD8545|nr:23S rRNA pseudouridine(1911/1915/1917) synthase RluD [Bowmanella yangjiangensis]MBT1064999.1 23S rRNA pseudouridine(1911/1915/1917) synthase RluD [Bowmanella yangjiangensis]